MAVGKITMHVYSGSSNQGLSKKLAKLLGEELGEVTSTQFENGEARVAVQGKKTHGEAVLLQSFSLPVDQHIIEFCLLADALTRMGLNSIVGVVPWLGYSKQDNVFLPGEPLSAKVVAQIIQTTKIKKLLTFDLHNRAITGFFDIPVVELSAKSIFLEYFKNKLKGVTEQKLQDYVVVAPDEGAVKSSAYFARELDVPIAYMDKRRDLVTGKVKVVGMSGAVKNKRVIIVDDMIVTGGTMMETAKYLKKQGATSVSVAATHHLYVPGVQEKLDASEIDEIVVTDTVACPTSVKKASQKLQILTVAELISAELQD
jgi:ribose-phosphate pyrophosphokinase